MTTASIPSPARLAARARKTEGLRVALTKLLAMIPTEIALKCPAVREFVLERTLKESEYIEQSIDGVKRAFVRWEDTDESPAGQFLAVALDGQWEFGFRGAERFGVVEFRGVTLPPLHVWRAVRLWRAGTRWVDAWNAYAMFDRTIKGPFHRTRYVYVMAFGSVITATVVPCLTRGILPYWRMFWFTTGPVLSILALYTLFCWLPVLWYSWRVCRPDYPTVEAV